MRMKEFEAAVTRINSSSFGPNSSSVAILGILDQEHLY
jgi:hypothetical protein